MHHSHFVWEVKWLHKIVNESWEWKSGSIYHVVAASGSTETTPIWESDTENPTKLSSPTVSWVLTSNTIHVYSIPWCVSSHRPALIILIGLCITRMWKVTPVCSLKAMSAFLHLDRVQHKWALHKCFLMRAMIALVSVVGPSLTEEENQRLLLSNG